jgi:hypothetical protein
MAEQARTPGPVSQSCNNAVVKRIAWTLAVPR